VEIPPGPIYIVQEGDTLWDIAYLFQVSVDEIVAYNNRPSRDIYVGDRLVIPGMEALTGTISTLIIPFGDTLRTISRLNMLDSEILVKLNKIVSPAEVYAGYEMILLKSDGEEKQWGSGSIQNQDSLLDFAVRQDVSIWEVNRINKINEAAMALPGDAYAVPGGLISSSRIGFPISINKVNIDPIPFSQGDTVQIWLEINNDGVPGGFLGKHQFKFFPQGDGIWVVLQGIYAMEKPGIYPLQISITSPGGEVQAFEQMVYIKSGNFLEESLYVDQTLIDPEVTEPENQWLISMVSTSSDEKLWDGLFQLPVAEDFYCLRSGFGNRRSYNAGELIGFHSGLDFGVCSESNPFDIYAPAGGTVIFVGEKTVRGNVTILDHGWGIYSGFWHQDEIMVNQGDLVVSGQLIGTIGSTGRVTGPHLHWEVWVNGIQVDPLDWLDEEFPHEE
jgi:murein DD-endopeptidase MepM/ murein hydrolase activator NlpD